MARKLVLLLHYACSPLRHPIDGSMHVCQGHSQSQLLPLSCRNAVRLGRLALQPANITELIMNRAQFLG